MPRSHLAINNFHSGAVDISSPTATVAVGDEEPRQAVVSTGIGRRLKSATSDRRRPIIVDQNYKQTHAILC